MKFSQFAPESSYLKSNLLLDIHLKHWTKRMRLDEICVRWWWWCTEPGPEITQGRVDPGPCVLILARLLSLYFHQRLVQLHSTALPGPGL